MERASCRYACALRHSVEGRDHVKPVMAAASSIYISLAFTRDAGHGDRHYLEGEATAFEDTVLRGVTILTKNDDGKIVHAAIHHRPLDGVRKFSAELGRRLEGKVDASHFYGAA